MSDVHLFLLVPNDSGSTWLQNAISLCRNCVSFQVGLDGKGVMASTHSYPDQEINKLFSEKKEMWSDPSGYGWELIKIMWHKAWSENPHYSTAAPRIYLEKTPQAIYASDMYTKHFDNVRFIISIRDPYATVEGMYRTIGNVSLERCARHWIECAKRQLYNLQTYRDISLYFTYEDLVGSPLLVASQIRHFIPALDDIDLGCKAVSHSIDGGLGARVLMDYNQRQIENLSKEDRETITKVVFEDPDIPGSFGYKPL